MSDNSHHESHSGQQNPQKQMLLTVLKSFLIPAVLIGGYVAVTTPAAKVEVSVDSQDKLLAKRIQKVGAVDIRSASGDGAKQARSGEDVFKGQCSSCHASGAAGAPKLADAAAWGARIKTGFDALLASAKKGKGNMPAQAGGDLDDLEIARAVVYMANASGGKFAEPKATASK
jgi:cytochrome c5